MIINGVLIDHTFAEAFPMKATRVIITAQTERWAYNAAKSMTGFATSVIGCGCEADIERYLKPSETPDGRPGVSAMLFTMGAKSLVKQLETRAGQSVLTSPTSALFSGIDGGIRIPLGKNLRYFGDGFQTSKLINDNRYWRIPVMDGEFLVEETTGQVNAIGGGNLLILAESEIDALEACEKAVLEMRKVPNVILPFPGGVVRSGSKVGSKYPALTASTNDAFCPTLKGITKSELSPEIESVMEIVIDGLTEADIKKAMRVGIETFCSIGAYNGVKRISAGNYGGKLGPYHFHLQEIMND
ncbi:MAG: formylmethanofuran--tetrahydromethanopterin N-formyltransferase [Methylococcales bacterium]|jgi:formylmethanofuran--tetrahydromethanopterin N-formyltransferase|nr:formylmethanofuran--tetrahydromethanopterin N-formyltransferase [Methylococcales bacterium]MDG2364082.1 formylmethanofuran--tetrahydromethanopterin N-formyltransferase [Methylococcaceae bacterium]MBT3699543.1 formylmethanofuran--tetrahydromethanopterin N-formyltransferase [Methylococcales bacterium]MBT4348680.1 formylmethanofuran--tetrahydromethanopterin N-formyltransferase [Methylococcales bacterium]MBT4765469.1 formylmethanofuran--tetrahydromethanopterin N-formyltransferase [Methylococcale